MWPVQYFFSVSSPFLCLEFTPLCGQYSIFSSTTHRADVLSTNSPRNTFYPTILGKYFIASDRRRLKAQRSWSEPVDMPAVTLTPVCNALVERYSIESSSAAPLRRLRRHASAWKCLTLKSRTPLRWSGSRRGDHNFDGTNTEP